MARKAHPSRSVGDLAPTDALARDVGLAPRLAFSFVVQGLLALIGIVSVPVFLQLLGAEGYGLVGFYTVLLAWMLVLELGISPAVSRQLSRFKAGALGSNDAAGLVKAAEIFFGAIACVILFSFVASSQWLRGAWLGASTLSPDTVRTSLLMLGCLAAVRWMTTFYHASMIGLERQNFLNIISLVSSISRVLFSIVCLLVISRSPVIFFASQLLLVPIEAVICRVLVFRAFGSEATSSGPKWGLLRQELRFASALAFTSTVWVGITQTDKLILSHVLSLRDFGLFSLVASICSGITLMTPPIVQLIQPRLTALLAQERRGDFVRLYRVSTSLMIALCFALAGTIAAQPGLVLLAYTGDRSIATDMSGVLSLYAAGTGIAAYLILPYLLQFAHGFLRLHVAANAIFGVIWIPAAIVAAYSHGGLGTGATWLAGNLIFVSVWVPIIHRRLLSSTERRGLTLRSLSVSGALAALLLSTRLVNTESANRGEAFSILVAIAAGMILVGVVISDDLRQYVLRLFSRLQRQLQQAR